MYKVASMFAGIGGMCLGFKQAKADVIWANEIDKYACETYRSNFGNDYLVEDDIKNVDFKSVPDFDILTAGFPCQPFSIAGQMKGFDDERGSLFFEIVKMLEIKKPQAFLLENVRNIESHNHGKTFKVIIDSLEKAGYFVKFKVLNSSKIGNVPQNRERMYIVGFKDKFRMDKFEFPSEINMTKTFEKIIDKSQEKPISYYYKNGKYAEMIKEVYDSDTSVYQIRRFYARVSNSRSVSYFNREYGDGRAQRTHY